MRSAPSGSAAGAHRPTRVEGLEGVGRVERGRAVDGARRVLQDERGRRRVGLVRSADREARLLPGAVADGLDRPALGRADGGADGHRDGDGRGGGLLRGGRGDDRRLVDDRHAVVGPGRPEIGGDHQVDPHPLRVALVEADLRLAAELAEREGEVRGQGAPGRHLTVDGAPGQVRGDVRVGRHHVDDLEADQALGQLVRQGGVDTGGLVATHPQEIGEGLTGDELRDRARPGDLLVEGEGGLVAERGGGRRDEPGDHSGERHQEGRRRGGQPSPSVRRTVLRGHGSPLVVQLIEVVIG